MNRFYALAFLLVIVGSAPSWAQKKSYNTTFISNVKFNENASGMWGFTQDGIDYAVIGTINTTKVYSLENPATPELVYDIPASNSIWREARYFDKHIYVTNDRGTDGVIIIDMSNLDSIRHKQFKPLITLGTDVDKEINTCHAINMDENGLLSLTGCNVSKRGVLMYDVKTDPWNPIYLGATDLVYAHDTYNRGDTMYVSEISSGRLGIYNIKDKANPVLMNTQTTSKAFTHNAWMSDDKKYIFTTDEREGSWVDAYDITDHLNLKLLDKYQISDAVRSIPHNTYYNKGYLVTSWYTEGIRVLDVHRPENMIEVAGYDTWEDPVTCHAGFFGCWGVYPYGQNDLVLGSDMQNGLYVIKVDYKRACYLEGTITRPDGTPLVDAKVQIVSDQLNGDVTSGDGSFKTGLADAGQYKVIITHPDFSAMERTVTLVNGEITKLDFAMVQEPNAILGGAITDKSGAKIAANINFTNSVETISAAINSDGTISPSSVKPGTYNVDVYSWGYLPVHQENVTILPGSTFAFNQELTAGFGDNFEADAGWQIINTPNVVGAWHRGKPRKTVFTNGITSNPGNDSDDAGQNCYVTGAAGTPGASCDDVDSGVSKLYSPNMNLTSLTNPLINYDAWFFNAGGNSAINDTLVVSLYDGTKEVIIDKIYGITGDWKATRGIKVNDFMTPSENMQIILTVSDQQQSGHIVEAGFDNFSVVSSTPSNTDDKILNSFSLYPNPANEYILVELSEKKPLAKQLACSFINNLGQVVKVDNIDFHTKTINIQDLPQGLYVVSIQGFNAIKFIKN